MSKQKQLFMFPGFEPSQEEIQELSNLKAIEAIVDQFKAIIPDLRQLSTSDKIECLNQVKLLLHANSPMNHEPVDCVIWVKGEIVGANDYNPNSVAPPEMELLKDSILEDGYTQPIVGFKEEDQYTVVDGFHRNRVGKEYEEIKKRVHGYLPIVAINKATSEREDRIASTIRHNRARGKHKIDSMSDIVLELKKRNWSDQKIGKKLGMEPDEVLRLGQITGLAEMFANEEFSQAWEAERVENEIIRIEE